MTDSNIRFHLLDASAIVKIVIKEPVCSPIRDHFPGKGAYHTTSLCIAETLNVLKLKWLRKELTQEQYKSSAYLLMAYVRDRLIHLLSISLENREVFIETERIAKKHNIDLSDALQLVALKTGFYKFLSEPSKPLLITADSGLAEAARAEGFKVWNCVKEPAPI